MTTGTSLLWFLSALALALSTGAVLAVALLWVRFRSSSAERLSSRLSEAETLIEQLSADFRNMRAARAMQAHRDKKRLPESSDPTAAIGDDEAAQKRAELNRRIAAGEFKPRSA